MFSNYRIHKYHNYYLIVNPEQSKYSKFFHSTSRIGSYSQIRNVNELNRLTNQNVIRFFHNHNIFVKFEELSVPVNLYYEALAMAFYYLSSGTEDGVITLNEVSLTICCSAYPDSLMEHFRATGYQIVNLFKGVFYIYKVGCFDTQIIIMEEKEVPEYTWIDYFLPNARVTCQPLAM